MLSVSQNKESPVHGPYVVSVNSCISFAEPRNSVGYCVRIIQVYVQTVSLYRQNKQKSLCNKCNYEAVLLLDIITSHIGQLYGNLPWEDSGPAPLMQYNICALQARKVFHCPSGDKQK